jgi:hypothetical protein
MPIKPPPIGEKFGRLTVIGSLHRLDSRGGRYDWQCRCDCGKIVVAQQRSVRIGHTVSCGCGGRGIISARNREATGQTAPIASSMILRWSKPARLP